MYAIAPLKKEKIKATFKMSNLLLRGLQHKTAIKIVETRVGVIELSRTDKKDRLAVYQKEL